LSDIPEKILTDLVLDFVKLFMSPPAQHLVLH